ncbi:hypothetical protein KVR01_013230 [Diaporthe batatas]|uniref:uncharacterized protein n=1 Tax=Diaporthe batatas TaxID=748121 RepID=UPI001D057497|nr:uncharacterized protein KVR01_013230 [Diaporthe batatas]KAG8157008.1 hypothetical protein KVR01_013230 [Diaporthe batatas]
MGYDCGDFSFFRNSSSAPEFSSRDFFFGIGKFFAADANIHMVVNEHSWEPIPLSQMNNTGLASALDGFAKAFYSFVLLDLGNPSLLTDGDFITYLLSQRNDTILGVDPTKALETFKGEMAPLSSTAAQLSLQYVCSVPQKKEIFSLVVSVIIGNIVLLSAFWSLLNWMASTCVSSQDRNWNHCVGCQCNTGSCRIETPSKVDEESIQLVMEKTG